MTAQLLRIPADEYHARPGLSASTATTLVTRSPLHAWTQHPAYGGKGRIATKSMDRGLVVHALVLGTGAKFEVLDFDDYRKKDAQAARDEVRERGLIPLLRHEHDDAIAIATNVKKRLAARGVALTGESEIAIEWHEDSPSGPVLCRGMMDHLILGAGSAQVFDLKITADAAPSSVERSAENYGYAIQAAAYRRALAALDPSLAGRVDFLFGFAEAEEPYAMNLCRPDGAFRELGERRWLRAVAAWGECIKKNEWPAYGDGINPLSPPAWAIAREELAA